MENAYASPCGFCRTAFSRTLGTATHLIFKFWQVASNCCVCNGNRRFTTSLIFVCSHWSQKRTLPLLWVTYWIRFSIKTWPWKWKPFFLCDVSIYFWSCRDTEKMFFTRKKPNFPTTKIFPRLSHSQPPCKSPTLSSHFLPTFSQLNFQQAIKKPSKVFVYSPSEVEPYKGWSLIAFSQEIKEDFTRWQGSKEWVENIINFVLQQAFLCRF